MLCLYLKSTDPFINLAVDEYLLKNRLEDFLVLSVNSPSVIIGKHQVAHREADTEFVSRAGIPVIRRISGGGAVFHDKGNLNFSFILESSQGHQVDFRKYTLPVIEFLGSLGICAGFEGKNDLKVDGRKISGNAEHVFRQRVLHHGTLLLDSKLELLKNSLRKDTSSYFTRAVASNPSPVMNLSEKIPGMTMSRFISLMIDFFLERDVNNRMAELTEKEESEIALLAEAKYKSWEWNYAYGPEYSLQKEIEIKGIPHRLSLLVKDGLIAESKVEGSDLMTLSAKNLERHRHMPREIEEVMNSEKSGIDWPEVYKFF